MAARSCLTRMRSVVVTENIGETKFLRTLNKKTLQEIYWMDGFEEYM